MQRIVRLLLVLTMILAPVEANASELCLVPAESGPGVVSCDQGGVGWESLGYRTWGGPPCGTVNGPLGCAPIRSGGAACVWSISASPTNPFTNTGPLLDGNLYLWLFCVIGEGLELANFDLEGSVVVTEFEPFPPFSNSGTATELRLTAEGCPSSDWQDPVVAGRVVLEPGTVSIDAVSWGRAKSRYR